MSQSVRSILLGAAIALGLAVSAINSARADVVYNYTGEHFNQFFDGPAADPIYYTTSDNVSASITFAQILAPSQTNVNVTELVTQFAVSDNHHTITNTNDSFWSLVVTTDASSQIISWSMVANGTVQHRSEPTNSFIQCRRFSHVHRLHLRARTFQYQGFNNHSPGEWTTITAVPEPSTWAMMLLGFAGVGLWAIAKEV